MGEHICMVKSKPDSDLFEEGVGYKSLKYLSDKATSPVWIKVYKMS